MVVVLVLVWYYFLKIDFSLLHFNALVVQLVFELVLRRGARKLEIVLQYCHFLYN